MCGYSANSHHNKYENIKIQKVKTQEDEISNWKTGPFLQCCQVALGGPGILQQTSNVESSYLNHKNKFILVPQSKSSLYLLLAIPA